MLSGLSELARRDRQLSLTEALKVSKQLNCILSWLFVSSIYTKWLAGAGEMRYLQPRFMEVSNVSE